jgi:hypothetical protein
MSHHFIHFRISSEAHYALSPASAEPTYYGTIEPIFQEDQVFDNSTLYDSDDEDQAFDSSTLYDSDDENSWIPYTQQPYRYYYTRQDLESQLPLFCNSLENCGLIFSQVPIWVTVLVCLMAVVGFGTVLGFLVAVAMDVDEGNN